MKHRAIFALVATAAVLAVSNGGAAAKGPGVSRGMHPLPFKSHFLSHHRHHLARRHSHNDVLGWPLYGGYYDMPPYDDAATGEPGEPPVEIVRQPSQLSCEKTRETITVPSETGGTRAITVTRC